MGHDILRIPVDVFERAETKEDLEDWLAANNPVWIAGMKKRAEGLREGRTRTPGDLRRRWPPDS